MDQTKKNSLGLKSPNEKRKFSLTKPNDDDEQPLIHKKQKNATQTTVAQNTKSPLKQSKPAPKTPTKPKSNDNVNQYETVEKSAFSELLLKGGFKFNYEDGKQYYAPNPIELRQFIEKNLSINNALLSEFQTAFATHIQNTANLIKCLLPLLSDTESSHGIFSGQSFGSDSLIKVLLGVDKLQGFVIETLLEILPMFAEEQYVITSTNITLQRVDNINISKLILTQLKWLDNIVDSALLREKLLQSIEVSPPELKKDIILAIPQIVDDSGHEMIAESLQRIMDEDTQYTVPVLDTFSNLSLGQKSMDSVRETVMNSLNTASIDDLPVVIRFIFQSTTNIQQIVHDFRTKFTVESLPTAMQLDREELDSQFYPSTNNKSTQKGGVMLILESIKSAIRCRREIANAFVKEIQGITDPQHHRILDMWVLFVLYSINTYKKAAEALLRKKILLGQFTVRLLRNSITNHANTLSEYFQSLLSLAEVFLRAPDHIIRNFASQLYTLTFLVFTESYHRQEVIGSILTHIGSGNTTEIDAALDILLGLVDRNPHNLIPYTAFIKGILDFVYGLEDIQVRKSFQIFSALSFGDVPVEDIDLDSQSSQQRRVPHKTAGLGMLTTMSDELEILIQKLLSHTNVTYKRIGIMGAIAMIKRVAAKQSTAQPLNQDQIAYIQQTLEKIMTCCQKSHSCIAFMCDELANVVRSSKLPLEVLDWIRKDRIGEDWNNAFLENISEGENHKESILFGLSEEESLIILVSPRLTNSDPITRESLVCLPAQFKVIQMCEKSINNSLSEMDGLIGAPLWLFSLEELLNFSGFSIEQKEMTCLALFHSINWMRELLNAFSSQEQPDIFVKVLKRLAHAVDLEYTLNKCLQSFSDFSLPASVIQAIFGINQSQFKPHEDKKGKKKATDSKKKKKSKGEDNNENQDQNNESDNEESAVLSIKTLEEELTHVAAFRPCFRELELETSLIMTHKSGTLLSESQVADQALDYIELELPSLRYLLSDFTHKMRALLVQRKKTSYLATAAPPPLTPSLLHYSSPLEALDVIKDVFVALSKHLERIARKGLQDEPDENRKHIVPCISMIFECFQKLLDFETLYNPQNEVMLKYILYNVVSTNPDPEQDPGPLEKLLNNFFEFISSFDITTQLGATLSIQFLDLLNSVLRYFRQHKNDLNEPDLKMLHQHNTKISTIAGELLKKKDWPEGKLKADQLGHLLRYHIQLADKPIHVIESLVLKQIPAVIQGTEEDNDVYASLTKQSLAAYYKVTMTELVTAFEKLIEAIPNSDNKTKTDIQVYFIKLDTFVKIFQAILEINRIKEHKTMLSIALRQGKQFVELFMKAIPFLKENFKEMESNIPKMMKTLQNGTRFMQSLCAHAKVESDRSLTVVVPGVRKVLEMLLFKVKMMVSSNGLLAAFKLSNLKHRNIQGEEVSSQLHDSNDEEEEEEQQEQEQPQEEQEEQQEDNSDTEKANKKSKKKKKDSKKKKGKEKKSKKKKKTSDDEEENSNNSS